MKQTMLAEEQIVSSNTTRLNVTLEPSENQVANRQHVHAIKISPACDKNNQVLPYYLYNLLGQFFSARAVICV
jgi:hypothetical protein